MSYRARLAPKARSIIWGSPGDHLHEEQDLASFPGEEGCAPIIGHRTCDPKHQRRRLANQDLHSDEWEGRPGELTSGTLSHARGGRTPSRQHVSTARDALYDDDGPKAR